MDNKKALSILTSLFNNELDPDVRLALMRSIKAVRAYRDCKSCSHRKHNSKYYYCDMVGCNYKPVAEETSELVS